MTDDLQLRVISIVQDTLREDSGKGDLSISPDDSMDTITEWDSMSFMKVFMGVNEVFGISPDFDEAIHYTSISTLTEFLRKETAQ
ncbi:acyl carrier protein [Seohaeicola saemankumensis]|uniref:Acyl carrier protein n=1 Tax=Seohaeicola saemankumensis TaxID=481181 RepID=A0ABW3TFT9_9RHOB